MVVAAVLSQSVGWRLFMVSFVHKKKKLGKFDTLLHGEPVKSNEFQCDRVILLMLDNDARRGALDILKFSD